MPTVQQNPTNAKQTAADKVAALKRTIDGSLDVLAKAVDEVRASDMFRAYLDVQARFHRYSWRNSMLILSQCPNASQVAGYRAWQKMKRQVRKGERGIRILAPCPYKREVEAPNGETDTVAGMFFRCVSVFDVKQTDGVALSTMDVPTVADASDALLADLVRVAESRKIAVTFGPIDGGAYGVSKHGAISVDDTHTTGQQAKTLAHELAHEALHWDIKGTFTRQLAELEAESVAYVVCRHFGLDSEVRSSRYIALWGGDSKSLKESLQRIAETARDIIDDVESAEVRRAVA